MDQLEVKDGPFAQLVANCLDKFGITLATGGNVLDVLKAMKAQNLEGRIGGAYYYEIPSSPPRYPSAGRPGRGHPSNRCNGMPLGTERGRCSQNRWTRRSKRAHVWPKTRHAALRIPEKRKGEQVVLLTERRNAARGELLEQAKTEGVSELHVPRPPRRHHHHPPPRCRQDRLCGRSGVGRKGAQRPQGPAW
jgi:hypothetical protein